MGRKMKDEVKRGRKHPEGFTKRNILLLAWKYPDGIEEPDLVELIRDELGITELKGIRGHLADLGEGRKISGTFREGKHYLLKEPQLGKENIWTPNPDFDIFREWARKFLYSEDLAIPFMRTEYTQRMVKEHIFDLIEKKFDIDLSTGEAAVEDLKDLVLKYPFALLYLFRIGITEEGEKDVIPVGPGIFKNTSLGHFISAIGPILPTRGQYSVGLLNFALSFYSLLQFDMKPEWNDLYDDEDLAKLRRLHETALDNLVTRSDV